MARLVIRGNGAAIFGGQARGTKEPQKLGHVERGAPKDVGFKGFGAEGNDKLTCRENERGGTPELVITVRCWVVLEQEKRVEMKHHRILVLEVRVIPKFLDIGRLVGR